MTVVGATAHTVRKVKIIHDGLFTLVLERNGLEFMPGDCVALHTTGGESRPYSIASGNSEPELRFIIRKMKGGEVSPWLMSRKGGDAVHVSTPFGWFCPAQNIGGAPFVFLATGTGIAPFLSYYNTYREVPPSRILYGVRREVDAVGAEQLEEWCDLRLAVSRETTALHHHGRLTALLGNLPLDQGMHYYLCGLESMINDTTQWLEGQGVDLSRIHREVFFHG